MESGTSNSSAGKRKGARHPDDAPRKKKEPSDFRRQREPGQAGAEEPEESWSVSETEETEWIIDNTHEAQRGFLRETKWYQQKDQYGNYHWHKGEGGWRQIHEGWRRAWEEEGAAHGGGQSNAKKRYRRVIKKKWFGWVDYQQDQTEERRKTREVSLNPECAVCRRRTRSGEEEAIQQLMQALEETQL